jgi:hypothetical protein
MRCFKYLKVPFVDLPILEGIPRYLSFRVFLGILRIFFTLWHLRASFAEKN